MEGAEKAMGMTEKVMGLRDNCEIDEKAAIRPKQGSLLAAQHGL